MDCNSTGYRLRNVTCINGTICSSLNKPHFNETCLIDCNNYIDSDLYVDLFIYMITNKPIENRTVFNITQIDQTINETIFNNNSISNLEQSKIDLNYSKNETNENNNETINFLFKIEINESNFESNKILSNYQSLNESMFFNSNNQNNLTKNKYSSNQTSIFEIVKIKANNISDLLETTNKTKELVSNNSITISLKINNSNSFIESNCSNSQTNNLKEIIQLVNQTLLVNGANITSLNNSNHNSILIDISQNLTIITNNLTSLNNSDINQSISLKINEANKMKSKNDLEGTSTFLSKIEIKTYNISSFKINNTFSSSINDSKIALNNSKNETKKLNSNLIESKETKKISTTLVMVNTTLKPMSKNYTQFNNLVLNFSKNTTKLNKISPKAIPIYLNSSKSVIKTNISNLKVAKQSIKSEMTKNNSNTTIKLITNKKITQTSTKSSLNKTITTKKKLKTTITTTTTSKIVTSIKSTKLKSNISKRSLNRDYEEYIIADIQFIFNTNNTNNKSLYDYDYYNLNESIYYYDDDILEYDWYIGDYGPCSKQCGTGYKSRRVVCRSKITYEETFDMKCIKSKPESFEKCVYNFQKISFSFYNINIIIII